VSQLRILHGDVRRSIKQKIEAAYLCDDQDGALLRAPAQIAMSWDALTDFANFRLKPDAEPLQQVTPCRLMGSGRE
jgi:hypothetical protein